MCWNKNKTKSKIKNTTNEYRYFAKSNFVSVNRLFVLNGKNIYDQPTDSDVKIKRTIRRQRHEEIRKLTTGQDEYYTTGYLLDYDYIKSSCRLITGDLS